jgi:hypothetical protein
MLSSDEKMFSSTSKAQAALDRAVYHLISPSAPAEVQEIRLPRGAGSKTFTFPSQLTFCQKFARLFRRMENKSVPTLSFCRDVHLPENMIFTYTKPVQTITADAASALSTLQRVPACSFCEDDGCRNCLELDDEDFSVSLALGNTFSYAMRSYNRAIDGINSPELYPYCVEMLTEHMTFGTAYESVRRRLVGIELNPGPPPQGHTERIAKEGGKSGDVVTKQVIDEVRELQAKADGAVDAMREMRKEATEAKNSINWDIPSDLESVERVALPDMKRVNESPSILGKLLTAIRTIECPRRSYHLSRNVERPVGERRTLESLFAKVSRSASYTNVEVRIVNSIGKSTFNSPWKWFDTLVHEGLVTCVSSQINNDLFVELTNRYIDRKAFTLDDLLHYSRLLPGLGDCADRLESVTVTCWFAYDYILLLRLQSERAGF